MSDEILRADPGLRRRTVVILTIAVLAAIGGLMLTHQWLHQLGDQAGNDIFVLGLRKTIGLALTGIAICLALLAWYTAAKGTRAVQTAQWPLPGARVLVATPIRRGAPAIRRGRQLQAAAIVLLLLAAAVGYLSFRLA